MTTTLQPVLSCGEGVSSDVSVFLSRGGTTYEVYLGVALLERVGADPESTARKMLVGRLCNAGVPITELKESFGHDPRTIRKWATALQSGDIDQIALAFAGRAGRRKTSPELIRYVQQLYGQRHLLGRNYREVIIDRVADVFGVRISTTCASGIFASVVEADPAAPQPAEMATALQKDHQSASGISGSVKQSPTPLPAQSAVPGGGKQWIHHAGQALFAEGMAGIADPVQRQFVAQILQGAVNTEQSKTLCGRSLAHVTGPVVTTLKAQRDLLDEQACLEEVIGVYKRNAQLLCDGPGRGDLFYFDPHTKEYTGQLKVLKGWCGRRHGIVKTLNLDAFHTRSGRPCFIRHDSPYYDMRERFFMALAVFDRLVEPAERRGRTFVLDRGIYSLPTLQSFCPDYVITWEKNYSGGAWDEGRLTVAFQRSLPRNSRGDLVFTRFECQQMPWRRDGSFRRIIVRATKENNETFEGAILTSHPDMDMQDVVWVMFRRWLQENDFKYLDTHFGLNQLTSRSHFCFSDRADQFEDRPVQSPEYRDLKAAVNCLEAKLGKRLVALRKARKDRAALEQDLRRSLLDRKRLAARLDESIQCLRRGQPEPRRNRTVLDEAAALRCSHKALQRKARANNRKSERLSEEVRGLESELEPLETRLCEALRKQSRVQLLVDGNYQMLDTRKKELMDALRVTASNIFRNVQEQFRAICDNFRDDHVFVRMLSRCSGTVEITDEAVVFQLWIPGTLQPHRVRAVDRLLAQLADRAGTAIPAARPIRIELLSGPLTT